MTVNKALCKYISGGFSRSITFTKGKFITRINIYSSKGKTLSFPQRKGSNVAYLPQVADW